MTTYIEWKDMKNTENNCFPESIEKNGIHYVLAGDVYLPLLAVSDHPQKPLGSWGSCGGLT